MVDFRTRWWTSIYAASADEARRLDDVLFGTCLFLAGAGAAAIGYALTLEETKDVAWDNLQQPLHMLL